MEMEVPSSIPGESHGQRSLLESSAVWWIRLPSFQITWLPAEIIAQLLSHVQLCVTPWIVAHQASLSFTISRSLLKLMSTGSIHWVSPSSVQLSHPLSPSSPTLSLSQHQGLFQWVGSLHQMAKVLELQHHSFQWIFRTYLFRIDWLYLLVVQGTLKSLFQYHSSKASVLQCSVFFMVQLSHSYMTTGKTIALTRWTFVGQVMSAF